MTQSVVERFRELATAAFASDSELSLRSVRFVDVEIDDRHIVVLAMVNRLLTRIHLSISPSQALEDGAAFTGQAIARTKIVLRSLM
ncbi:MAG TPA: hypothetical protein VGM82_12875 [Gemmatimonadaceae bacterium]|jgi:hypothetical protein